MKNLFTSILFLVFFTGVSFTADFKMYGDLSLNAFWMNPARFSEDTIGKVVLELGDYPIFGSDSLDIWESDWLPAGKFGIKFTKDRFGACIEFGITKNTFASKLSGSQTTRILNNRYGYALEPYKWYMEWYISELFTLLAGQDFPLTNLYNINKILNPELHYATMGYSYTKSRPMFKFTFHSRDSLVMASIAAIKVDTSNHKFMLEKDDGLVPQDKYYIDEIIIPKFEGNTVFSLEKELIGVGAKVVGGFQTYKIFVHPKIKHNVEVRSYLVGGNLSFRIWNITLSGNAFYGQNLGPYGLVLGEPYAWWRMYGSEYVKMYYPTYIVDTLNPMYEAHTFNSTSMEWAIAINISPWDFVAIEAGYQDIIGEHEYKDYDNMWKDSNNYAWYGNLTFKIFEYMSLGIEYGSTVYGKQIGFGEYSYIAAKTGLEF